MNDALIVDDSQFQLIRQNWMLHLIAYYLKRYTKVSLPAVLMTLALLIHFFNRESET